MNILSELRSLHTRVANTLAIRLFEIVIAYGQRRLKERTAHRLEMVAFIGLLFDVAYDPTCSQRKRDFALRRAEDMLRVLARYDERTSALRELVTDAHWSLVEVRLEVLE